MDVLRQYENNRFVALADISPLQLAEFQFRAFHNLPAGFEAILLSPLSPLGSCSVLGTVNQNKVVTTIRNTEVCSDSTNIMALESAKRLKQLGIDTTVKLAACQRVMRAQQFNNPNHRSHFHIFCLTTAGKLTADYDSLLSAAHEHLQFYLSLFQMYSESGFESEKLEVCITAINPQLFERLETQLLYPLSRKYPNVACQMDQERRTALNYYQDFTIAIRIRSVLDGKEYRLVDGGNTDWTQKLLNNHKVFFLSSCIGIDLFFKLFLHNR